MDSRDPLIDPLPRDIAQRHLPEYNVTRRWVVTKVTETDVWYELHRIKKGSNEPTLRGGCSIPNWRQIVKGAEVVQRAEDAT